MTRKQWFGFAFSLAMMLYLAYAVWQRTLGPIEENVLAPLIPLVLMLYFTTKDLLKMHALKKRNSV